MKILFLSTWLPYPPNHGNRIRSYYLLRELSRRHEVTLLSFIQDPSERQYLTHLETLCEKVVTIEHDPFARPLIRGILSYFVLQPKFLFAGHSREMALALDKEVASGRHDVLICEVMVAASYGKHITAIPTIYDDLELGQFLDDSTSYNGFRRVRRFASNEILRRYLKGLVRTFSFCTVPSQAEQDLVSSFLHYRKDRLPILPNGVDISGYQTAVPLKTENPYLVFNGSLTFSPNYEAMQFFIQKVWPSVRERFPSLELRITGSLKNVDTRPLSSPGVIFTGYLDDIRPTVAGARACITPILSGGGTRLKVLEAMALKVPVIATTKAVEGLDVVPGKHVLIADTPSEFVNAIAEVLTNSNLRKEMAQSAYNVVAKQYDWQIIGQQLENLLQQIM